MNALCVVGLFISLVGLVCIVIFQGPEVFRYRLIGTSVFVIGLVLLAFWIRIRFEGFLEKKEMKQKIE